MQASPKASSLEGICLISSRSGKDPVSTISTPLPNHPVSSIVSPAALRVRALVRLARQREAVGIKLGAVCGSGVAAAAAAFATVEHMHTASVQPLAPARAPLSAADAVAATTPRHRHPLLRNLAVNPLRGIASWYGSVLHGHTTASGEIFDEAKMTACHRTLPFGTIVRVTDTSSQRSVVVRINDRGVLNADRVIDLSAGAAEKLGILRSGLASVRLEVLKARPAPEEN